MWLTEADVMNRTKVDDSIGLALYGVDTYPVRRMVCEPKGGKVAVATGEHVHRRRPRHRHSLWRALPHHHTQGKPMHEPARARVLFGQLHRLRIVRAWSQSSWSWANQRAWPLLRPSTNKPTCRRSTCRDSGEPARKGVSSRGKVLRQKPSDPNHAPRLMVILRLRQPLSVSRNKILGRINQRPPEGNHCRAGRKLAIWPRPMRPAGVGSVISCGFPAT